MPATRFGPRVGAVLVVDEHEVDVAAVVQLLAAELAEGEDRRSGQGRLPGTVGARAGRNELWRRCRSGRQASGDFQGGVGDVGDVAGDLLQGAVADDVVGADAQELPLAVAAEGAQHGRVLEGAVHLSLELRLHLGGAGAAPQRHAQHVEVVGIGPEQIAERLADAEQLQQDFQGAGAVLQQERQLLGAGRLGEEALQVVEGHVGVGAARQQAVQGGAEVAQAVARTGWPAMPAKLRPPRSQSRKFQPFSRERAPSRESNDCRIRSSCISSPGGEAVSSISYTVLGGCERHRLSAGRAHTPIAVRARKCVAALSPGTGRATGREKEKPQPLRRGEKTSEPRGTRAVRVRAAHPIMGKPIRLPAFPTASHGGSVRARG